MGHHLVKTVIFFWAVVPGANSGRRQPEWRSAARAGGDGETMER